jgi:adenosylhomocysteine nucleosidase
MNAAAEAAGQSQTASADKPPERPRDVCHVGVVFALGIEAGGLVDLLQGVVRIDGASFSAREGGLKGRRIVVVESGVGAEAGARATEALIQGHEPRWVISAGFAGGLHENLAQGDILMADEIVSASGQNLFIEFPFDRNSIASERRLHVGRLLTSDRVIADAAEKAALGHRHEALAVDMESLAVAEVCRRENARFISVRIISDAVGHSLPKDIDYLVKRKTTASRLGAAAGAIFRRPGSIKDMWQLKEDALAASDRLAKFLAGIIEQLPKGS